MKKKVGVREKMEGKEKWSEIDDFNENKSFEYLNPQAFFWMKLYVHKEKGIKIWLCFWVAKCLTLYLGSGHDLRVVG